ncbi:MAG: hypothetical protein A3J54_02635 [Candidatus Ryanbacteria bacterium RIFCSPHIGHO2_02_FULL_45_13b]|uniref:PIN domain-containing protein n=1 Tax=Candidatus Ryanbacteria bacterium RIFCSPHIGHO2_02_FULL_45_13b TaxID=1802117 RepID=A0A1G2G7P3_9BACT|nr:MAG: hypothetical protein A3J54_02635 [Candidatus Ryanbacteria bacterium RIFCSPHIGHO2_02_FULL_45_13b]
MIIDTSVVVKWFYEETETPLALRIFDHIADHTIWAAVPDILFYEFANTLKTKGKADRIDVESTLSVLHALPWVIVPPNFHFMNHALQVAEQYDISVYDASYAALAFEWNVPLMTSDERLARKIGHPVVQLLRDYQG